MFRIGDIGFESAYSEFKSRHIRFNGMFEQGRYSKDFQISTVYKGGKLRSIGAPARIRTGVIGSASQSDIHYTTRASEAATIVAVA